MIGFEREQPSSLVSDSGLLEKVGIHWDCLERGLWTPSSTKKQLAMLTHMHWAAKDNNLQEDKVLPSVQLSKAKATRKSATLIKRPLPPCEARKCALPNSESWKEVRLQGIVWQSLGVCVIGELQDSFCPGAGWHQHTTLPSMHRKPVLHHRSLRTAGSRMRGVCVCARVHTLQVVWTKHTLPKLLKAHYSHF